MIFGISGNMDGTRQLDMTEITYPSLERLFQLYIEHEAANPVRLNFNCIQCGQHFELELHRTSRGFGINGGVLLVNSEGQLLGE